MSRVEPPPEDRKLSSVKSWFSRSVSFGGIHGSSAALAAGAASKGLPEGNGHNGEDQDTWGGFNTTLGKHLSMRWGIYLGLFVSPSRKCHTIGRIVCSCEFETREFLYLFLFFLVNM